MANGAATISLIRDHRIHAEQTGVPTDRALAIMTAHPKVQAILAEIRTAPTEVPAEIETAPTVVRAEIGTTPTVALAEIETAPTEDLAEIGTTPTEAQVETETAPTVAQAEIGTAQTGALAEVDAISPRRVTDLSDALNQPTNHHPIESRDESTSSPSRPSRSR